MRRLNKKVGIWLGKKHLGQFGAGEKMVSGPCKPPFQDSTILCGRQNLEERYGVLMTIESVFHVWNVAHFVDVELEEIIGMPQLEMLDLPFLGGKCLVRLNSWEELENLWVWSQE